jgi:serine/threonine-protein kinase
LHAKTKTVARKVTAAARRDQRVDCRAVSARLAAGTRLGRYEIVREIASGGMATVYLARVTGPAGFEGLFALKVIHPHLAGLAEFVSALLDEARIAARLRHPNVARTFDVGAEAGTHYLVLEYVEGSPLASVLRAAIDLEDRLDLRVACRIVADAAAGLHHAHELASPDGTPMGLVHRDVSPQNLLVSWTGGVVLLDFGIAKAAGRLGQTTSAGTVKGKFAYMSPEQARGHAIDRRSDVYSLGLVLYEATTGKSALKREAEPETFLAAIESQVTPPERIRSGYPPALAAIVGRALAKDPSDRYQSADALRAALESFLASTGPAVGSAEVAAEMRRLLGPPPPADAGPAEAATVHGTVETSVHRAKKPGRVVPIALGALLAVGVGVGLWASGREPDDAPPAAPSALPAPETVRLEIRSTPPQARVRWNGVLAGTNPFVVRVARSEVPLEVVVEATGHRTERRLVTPDSDRAIEVPLVAEPATAAAPAVTAQPDRPRTRRRDRPRDDDGLAPPPP